MKYQTLKTPIGLLVVTVEEACIRHIVFEESVESKDYLNQPDGFKKDKTDPVLNRALVQLRAYFSGCLPCFDLPLGAKGTGFQQAVWSSLRRIPYGETWSYADVANYMNKPTATRAVGAANGQNPISIVVPCHRVIGKNGSLTGYAGGLDRKAWLLQHERELAAGCV